MTDSKSTPASPPGTKEGTPFARVVLTETPNQWPVLTVGDSDIVFVGTYQRINVNVVAEQINSAYRESLAPLIAERDAAFAALRQAREAMVNFELSQVRPCGFVPAIAAIDAALPKPEDRDER